MTHAALLVNARANGNRTPESRRALCTGFAGLGPIAETDDPAVLPALFDRWRDAGVNLIVLAGGDGTIHTAVRAMTATWGDASLPRILLLHAGTLGLVARSAAVPAPHVALARLRERLVAGTPLPEIRLNTLRINGRPAFNIALGLFHTFARWFLEAKSTGVAAAWETTLRAAVGALAGGRLLTEAFCPWAGTVCLDGCPVDTAQLYGLYASSVPDMWIFRSVAAIPTTGDQFRVVRVQLSPLALLARLPLVLAGVPNPIGRGNTAGISHMEVSHPAGVTYMADGEFYTTPDPLIIQAGPPIRVIRS